MAFLYVKNREDALDVTQEVAYQSFKNIHTVKKPDYFKTWLMRITINCAVNMVRENVKVVQFKPGFEEFIGSGDEDISLSLTLRDLMIELQEEEKSVVLLRFYKDYTFKEISETLDIPLGTAKSILYRAINRLREKFKEVDISE